MFGLNKSAVRSIKVLVLAAWGMLVITSAAITYANKTESIGLDLTGGRAVLPRLKQEWKKDISLIEKSAPLASEFRVIPYALGDDRYKPREKSFMKTKAWAALGKDYLVVHFVCFDPAMKEAIPPKITGGHDSPVWRDDYVDVGIDINNDKETFFYIVANRLGIVYDSACERPFKVNKEWNSGTKVKIIDREDGWAATFRIPLSELGAHPGAGDIFSMTVGRSKVFNKKILQAVMPEDFVAIEYERKLEKAQMREESSITPFSWYNWYYDQRKMYFPDNFRELVVEGEAGRPINIVSTTRGVLRPEKTAWNQRFVAFTKNRSKKSYTLVASVARDGSEVASQTVRIQPNRVAAINLPYECKGETSTYTFAVRQGKKTLYQSSYRTLPELINFKRPRDGEYIPELVVKSKPAREFGGVYWPHHIDSGYGLEPEIRYYNLLGAGIPHQHLPLLKDVGKHAASINMMWERPGCLYNELKVFASVFRKEGIRAFLLPHVGISYSYEEKQLYTTKGDTDLQTIPHNDRGQVYLLHPKAREFFIDNILDALRHNGDLIDAIYTMDEGEGWLIRCLRDTVWNQRDKFPEFVKQVEDEFKNKYGFGKFDFPKKGEDNPFKQLALRSYISDKMLEFGKVVRSAVHAVNPKILIGANDTMHGFDWIGAARYKGTYDIAFHQLNNFPSNPGKCEAEIKYLVDVSGVEVWGCPHLEGWSNDEETREALSEIFRVGVSGLLMWNDGSPPKYAMHDIWYAPARFAFENQVVDLLAEGYRIKLPEKADMAVMVSVDSIRAFNQESAFGAAHTLMGPGTGAWYRFIDEDVLELGQTKANDFKVIVVPYAPIIRKDAVQKLVEAAKNGTTLILYNDVFQQARDESSYDAFHETLLAGAVRGKKVSVSSDDTFSAALYNTPKNTINLTPTAHWGGAHCYEGKIDRALMHDKNGNVIAIEQKLGAGKVIWVGYNPFNWGDAVDPAWRTFFRSILQAHGIKTDENIWRFKFKKFVDNGPQEKGICLTGNACYWEYNRPRVWQNLSAPVSYTYGSFPNAIGDIQKEGWVQSNQGKLTDRLKRFDEVVTWTLNDGKTSFPKWVVAWTDVKGANITFDLGQTWKLDNVQFLLAEYRPSVEVAVSVDGKKYHSVGNRTAKGDVAGSNLEIFSLEKTKAARYLRISLGKVPAEKRAVLAEVEIWSKP